MANDDLMGKLIGVFRNLFGDETLTLSRVTTAQDVEGWDSLMHINLILAIEREFRIRFKTREIAALKNIGELMDLIALKQGVSS